MGEEHDNWLLGFGVDVAKILSVANDAASSVGQGIKDATTAGGQALSNLGSSAAADLHGGLPAFNSGASLPSPSYVNAQDPNSNLAGGPNASAGDSSFVSGGGSGGDGGSYAAKLTQRATSLEGTAQKLYNAEKALEDQAKGDKTFVDSAKNIKAAADGMMALAHEIDDWTGKNNVDSLKKGDKALDFAEKLIKAAETVDTINSLNDALDKFQKHPDYASAKAWATGVGAAFDAAAAWIPSDGNPDADLIKGLLSAPKNYIAAFITLQDVYYKNIPDPEDSDSQSTGLGGFLNIGHDYTQLTSDGKWKGDLTGIYYNGFMQPKLRDQTDLMSFMIKHRTTEGPDLWNVKIDVGKALLQAAIESNVADDDPAKKVWLSYVAGFSSAGVTH